MLFPILYFLSCRMIDYLLGYVTGGSHLLSTCYFFLYLFISFLFCHLLPHAILLYYRYTSKRILVRVWIYVHIE